MVLEQQLAHAQLGAPVGGVEFGTAVTFDIVDEAANYTGGIIAPGLSAMTDYLHEKTALLPRIRITEPESIIGKDTRGAMLSGAVHGYRGLIAELVRQLKRELGVAKLPVVATGGCAALMASQLVAELQLTDQRADALAAHLVAARGFASFEELLDPELRDDLEALGPYGLLDGPRKKLAQRRQWWSRGEESLSPDIGPAMAALGLT